MYLGECMVAIQNDWQSFRVLLFIAQLLQLPTSTSNLLSINCVQYHALSTIPACFRSCIRVSYSSTSLPACRAKTLPWSPSVHIVIEPPRKWSCLQNPRRLSENWAPLKSPRRILYHHLLAILASAFSPFSERISRTISWAKRRRWANHNSCIGGKKHGGARHLRRYINMMPIFCLKMSQEHIYGKSRFREL
jgi:hypothetical protein